MPSPSEFMTLYRRTARLSTLRQSRIVPASPRRTFVSSTCRYSSGGKLSTDDSVANEAYPDSEHATDKKDKLDVQSANAAEGQKSKNRDEGGTATQRRDSNNSTSQAKKEHPEAPDVVIGMQDERGGKGA
ncbi:hypothetical protein E4T50_07474 [Aureobasidium sp. EXF-12298]|nr:hypothetical protein E4T50_07474 [Aureobasidium sp. EXF-12298]KAI4759493.1 hypothetical protein E4T51_07491 [Aureobasidium sp. EXF-12344]KAI4776685.1 hypothetical protein E4T52_08371 [Aureobasidium sp. EXF-3400]